ncbi:MAG: signal peptidase I [Candidatus Moranbacteria bacterium]|nr:signal peptidase I [Candidatus Moranbacteria bacterium]
MKNNLDDKGEDIKQSSKKKDVLDFIKYVVIAILIVIPIRIFIAQPFVVSGESMFPTFLDGDYLIVDEVSYHTGEPERGDVVIFKYPLDPKRFFIKRIIGLPNESIEVKDGIITIKNTSNPQGFTYPEPYLKQDFKDTFSYQTANDEYFVLGDNRARSSDSRYWGSLPKNLIIGRAFVRLLPLKDISYLPGNIK